MCAAPRNRKRRASDENPDQHAASGCAPGGVAVELGLYPGQCGTLSVVFDSLRDYAQQAPLRFHPVHGLWARVADVQERVVSELFIAPERNLWRYECECSASGARGDKDEDAQHSLTAVFQTLYPLLKSVPRDHRVWARYFPASRDAQGALQPGQWELYPFQPRSRERAKPLLYREPAEWHVLRELRDSFSAQQAHPQRAATEQGGRVRPGEYSHALWVSTAEFMGAVNRVNVLADTRLTLAIRGSCLVFYAQHYDLQAVHLHGTPAARDAWLTPLERVSEPGSAQESAHESPLLSNLPALAAASSLKINFCNKIANKAADRVLVALPAAHTANLAVLLYFPLRGFPGAGCFKRFRIAAPARFRIGSDREERAVVPPRFYECTPPETDSAQ